MMHGIIAAEGAAAGVTSGGIVGSIVEAFTGFLSGIGTGIVTLFNNLFADSAGNITTFAIVGLTMLGLGIASSMVTFLVGKVIH